MLGQYPRMAKRGKYEVKIIDRGWNDLMKQVRSVSSGAVKVGVLGSEASAPHLGDVDRMLSIVEVAAVQEFGIGVPARSFIRETFDLHRSKYERQLRELAGKILDRSMTVERALGIMGAQIASDMKARIVEGRPPFTPNAPSTIDAKGSSRPLVDTAQLLNSITWQVLLHNAFAGRNL